VCLCFSLSVKIMTKSKRKQSEKEPSSIQDDDYDSKYVEYGSPSNAERLASSLAEDSSGDSGTSYGYDHGSQGRLQRNQASMGSQSSDDNVSSDDNFFAQVPIRSRQRFTVQEISTLEKIYEKSERPSTDIKQNLANKLNTTVNRIQIWFQNRRAKDKKTTREQNKSPEGSDIARAHGINEPESRAAARGSSELGARRDSAESLSQVLSRCDSITHEFKRRADNGPEVSHNKKKKPVYQSAQGNPSASIEGHNVHPFANVPTLYRYPTTVELFPPYCWPGYLSRIASGSNLMPSDQQGIPR
jgi:hypothetical protein